MYFPAAEKDQHSWPQQIVHQWEPEGVTVSVLTMLCSWTGTEMQGLNVSHAK